MRVSAYLHRGYLPQLSHKPIINASKIGTVFGRKADSVDNVSDMLFPLSQPSKLSPSQAAEVLQIHKRTLRRWSVLFANSLSPSAGATGKKRYYQGTDIQTLRRVEQLKARGMKLSEIAEILPIVPADENESTSVVLAPEQNLVIGGMIERAKQLGDELESQDERLKRLEDWSKLPWYKKLFGSP